MGYAAGRELREERVMYLRSESKETSAMAAKDQRYFTKGRGLILGMFWDSGRRATRRKKKEKDQKLRDKERICCS